MTATAFERSSWPVAFHRAWCTNERPPKSVLNQRIGDRWGHTAVVRAPAVPATAARGAAVGILIGVLVWGALIALSTILKCL